jgi:hypothetical protein
MPYKADPQSRRSKRRANRGFKSLEQSCRKHRRALSRLGSACVLGGSQLKPGDKYLSKLNGFTYTAGGAMRYH